MPMAAPANEWHSVLAHVVRFERLAEVSAAAMGEAATVATSAAAATTRVCGSVRLGTRSVSTGVGSNLEEEHIGIGWRGVVECLAGDESGCLASLRSCLDGD